MDSDNSAKALDARYRRAGARLRDLTIELLEIRAGVLRGDDPAADALRARVDARLRFVISAWCGETFTCEGGGQSVTVATTAMEDLFPLEYLRAADSAFCGGLVVDGGLRQGAACYRVSPRP